jgi:uncharacterized cofD-like protein
MADLQPEPVASGACGETAGISRVTGESRITAADGSIARVYLVPDDVPAYSDAMQALLEADLIVAGPGSLYTSVLPNLLVQDVAQAVATSRALKVYVCNVATQRGETDGYLVSDHVAALEAHVGEGLFPVVLANDNLDVAFHPPAGVELVQVDVSEGKGYRVVAGDLVDREHPWRHDSDKLAQALLLLHKESFG